MKTLILSTVLVTMAYISNAQLQSGNFVFEGIQRNYLVFLPQNYTPNMPVVFNLHGYTDNANWQMNYSIMNNVADTAGFIVVYPNSVGPGFHTGLYRDGAPVILNVNDVGFISALIDTLKAHYNIDLSRVYSCGFSNGGVMAIKLACQLGHRLAAGATVAGCMLDSIADYYYKIRSFPMLICNGTWDGSVVYEGSPQLGRWSVENSLNFWIQNNDCVRSQDTVSLPDLDPNDGCTVEKISYKDCSDETSIIFYKVIKGGHSWPGTISDLTWAGEGNRNMDININVEIWNFFKNHQNPLVNLVFAKTVEIDPFYNQSLGYPLTVRSRLSNPESHSATVWATIQGEQSQFVDSLQLFDDGLHGDGGASDNMWGNMKSIQGLSDNIYIVDVMTHDDHFSDIQDLRYVAPVRFTTIGPVTLENYNFVSSSDTVFDPGDRIEITLTLKNNGSADTARNIEAKIISLDTLVSVSEWYRGFGDLTPGEDSTSSYYRITISEMWTGISQVPLVVEITSDDYMYWKDTLYIPVQGPVNIEDIRKPITRIYPNPTDNMLNVEISNTGNQGLEIEFFTVTGKVIYQKKYKNINAHFVEQIDLSGYAKGMYLVKVRQANSVYVEKVVVR